jgi:hypothetical protein
VHAATEGKSDEVEFNVKAGREDIFKPPVGNESLYEISNDSGIRVVKFSTLRSLIVKSTVFLNHNIHEYTWTSPDGKTHNQIDRVLIKGSIQLQLMSNILEELSVILTII